MTLSRWDTNQACLTGRSRNCSKVGYQLTGYHPGEMRGAWGSSLGNGPKGKGWVGFKQRHIGRDGGFSVQGRPSVLCRVLGSWACLVCLRFRVG